MKILVNNGYVLDTKTKALEKGNKYDIECIDQAILFNITKENNIRYCDIYFKGNFKEHQSYNKTLIALKSKNINYYDSYFSISPAVKFISAVNSLYSDEYNKAQGGLIDSSQEGKIDIQTYHSTDAQKENNFIQNMVNYTEGGDSRTIDIPQLLQSSERDEVAAKMISDAKKIIKNNYPMYYYILRNCDEIYLHRYGSKEQQMNQTLSVCPGTLLIFIEYVLSLSLKQLVFDLCHEAAHLIFRHSSRLKLRNPDYWNLVGDLVVNKALCEDFNITPTKGNSLVEFNNGIIDPNLNLNEETTETLYWEFVNELNQQQQQMQSMDGMQPPTGGSSGRGGKGQQGGQSGDQPQQPDNTNPLAARLRGLLDRIKDLCNDPLNESIKPLVEDALEKQRIEERLQAIGA